MYVYWVTIDSTANPTVFYGEDSNSLTMSVKATTHQYYLPLYESPFIHYATLTGLKKETRYYYKCGDSQGGWSSIYSFTTEPASPPSPSKPLSIGILADHGTTDNSKMVWNGLMKFNEQLNFGFTLLSGDLSYANGIQHYWDDYGNMIQPLASQVPFMASPGNHEAIELFISYSYRFQAPTNGYMNLYYSFNYQNVHVLVLNSESINEFHWSEMYQFAAADLKKVNRSVTPWIIGAWHHPWYCSNTKHNDSAWFMKDEYEDLFHQHKVDLVLQGHVHAYERTYSIYNWKVDPSGPVFITNGHAGTGEGLYYGWQQPKPDWSAYRESVYGFSTLTIFNSTHLHWQMIRATDHAVRDEFWYVRERSF